MLVAHDGGGATGAARGGVQCQVRTVRRRQRVGAFHKVTAARFEVSPVAANGSDDEAVARGKLRSPQFKLDDKGKLAFRRFFSGSRGWDGGMKAKGRCRGQHNDSNGCRVDDFHNGFGERSGEGFLSSKKPAWPTATLAAIASTTALFWCWNTCV